MTDRWIVLANASRCRVLAADAHLRRIKEVLALDNPNARLHEGDLVSDEPGHISDIGVPQNAYRSRQSAKERIIENFARKVGRSLELGRQQSAFAHLTLVAPPAFLGLLRKQLSDSTLRIVRDEITSDIVDADDKAVRRHLAD